MVIRRKDIFNDVYKKGLFKVLNIISKGQKINYLVFF